MLSSDTDGIALSRKKDVQQLFCVVLSQCMSESITQIKPRPTIKVFIWRQHFGILCMFDLIFRLFGFMLVPFCTVCKFSCLPTNGNQNKSSKKNNMINSYIC